MVSWRVFPSLPPHVPLALAFLSRLKLPFPPLSNTCHAGYPTAWSKIPRELYRCVCILILNMRFNALLKITTQKMKKKEDKREQSLRQWVYLSAEKRIFS